MSRRLCGIIGGLLGPLLDHSSVVAHPLGREPSTTAAEHSIDSTTAVDPPPPEPPFRRLVHRWPYEAGHTGWVAEPWTANETEHRRISGRLSAEGSYLPRGIWRSGVSARVGLARVDLDSQMSFYIEPSKQQGVYLGDTSLNFAPIARPNIILRLGAGARYLLDARLPGRDARQYAAGWNLSASLDAFPGRPFVISARVDRGMLYRSHVSRARATVGLVRRHFEIFAGYDHTQIEQAHLGGPLIGLRVWR